MSVESQLNQYLDHQADQLIMQNYEEKLEQIYEQKLDDIRDFVTGIHEHLYGDGELNAALLDHCMDELTWMLKLDLPKKELNVERKSNNTLKQLNETLQSFRDADR